MKYVFHLPTITASETEIMSLGWGNEEPQFQNILMYGMDFILSEKSPSKWTQDPPLSSIPDPPKTLNIYQFILFVLSMQYFIKYDSAFYDYV